MEDRVFGGCRRDWHPSRISPMPSPGRVTHPGTDGDGMGLSSSNCVVCTTQSLNEPPRSPCLDSKRGMSCLEVLCCPSVSNLHLPQPDVALLPRSSRRPEGAEPGQPEKCRAALGKAPGCCRAKKERKQMQANSTAWGKHAKK